MELKTNTLVSPKFVFQRIKFKVLHYIQHDFIRQRPGFSKDQASTFKGLAINYFILKYCHTFIKGEKYLFFYKSRCGKCSLKIKLFIVYICSLKIKL